MSEVLNKVGIPLKAAFLRGETVIASQFAAVVGSTRQAVTDQLAALAKRKLVKGERLITRAGAFTVYSCIDAEGMAVWEPRFTRGRPKKAPQVPALMEAWGMRVMDIDLPKREHKVWIRDEDMEAA